MSSEKDAVEQKADKEIKASEPTRKKGLKKAILGLLVITGCAGGGYWWRSAQNYVTTDNAYVNGHIVTITNETAGRMQQILVNDTDSVRAGDLLVKMDAQLAESQYRASLESLAASVRAVKTMEAQRRQAAAKILSTKATLTNAKQTLDRRAALRRSGSVSLELLEKAQTDHRVAVNAHEEALAAWQALNAQLLNTTVENQPSVKRAAEEVRSAWLTLQKTQIRAPVAGRIVRLNSHAGEYLAAGTRLMQLIPLDRVWIDANFKESQLSDIRVGQPVDVIVDMYETRAHYSGVVAGFAAGTGASMAIIPAQNATGNWIKIVQRLPVRIELNPKDVQKHPLMVGLSAAVTVKLKESLEPVTTLHSSLAQTQAADRPLKKVDAVIESVIRENLSR